ncbi:hypothetical protein DOTSEDRAFT_92600 [Dothistroma septosporum NZE10]|uniref:Phosphate transporter n=1 Tax=Dothistroma septosporum (strain NZE10 / CBS 128990) TaxID=675120 RepID=M2XZB1_DOTSN|nr:hypothetical protein DOTSEDRAFT_92600 [Dothistroma septosporum NZE10]
MWSPLALSLPRLIPHQRCQPSRPITLSHDDVANAWAPSVSSRSISYRWAMVLATVFEMICAVTVGARTADTINNGIISNSVPNGNAGVEMLAFTCALAGASILVIRCTRHSAHVFSTYSLISTVAGVGVAVAGADKVQWGWNNGKGLSAIFAGLGMAPAIAGGFGAPISMLMKLVVHLRTKPVSWAVWTSPFFFLISGTICTLPIVYKGSPNLKVNTKPPCFIVSVTIGTGFGLVVLAALFFVPYVQCVVVKKDYNIRWYHISWGPGLFRRPVRNYAVIQDDEDNITAETEITRIGRDMDSNEVIEKSLAHNEAMATPVDYQKIRAEGQERLHRKLWQGRRSMGWAMRTLHENPIGLGEIYEIRNMKIFANHLPAMIVAGALHGAHYDIHAAQSGIHGTPECDRMARVYGHAKKYPNTIEHPCAFVRVLTACTASFAHGASDIGNAVGPWAVIYAAWNTGEAAASKAPVPVWRFAKQRAAVNVLIFSQFSLPVSTSMCITGATLGVGLCNERSKAVDF